MASTINTALLRISKRAESVAREQLIATFVDVGPLLSLLASRDHQILFGRRGTGKTHALSYLASTQESHGDAIVFVDLRNIGSNGGLYADESRPLQERATGLLVDTLLEFHSSLYRFFVDRAEELDLSQSGPALDELAEAITQVQVVGTISRETSHESTTGRQEEGSAGISISPSAPSANLGASNRSTSADAQGVVVRRSGAERLHVNFGSVGAAFRRIVALLGGRHCWVLLDEWSSVPAALQPFLADLVRRSLLPITGITVKIGAIEQRSRFQIRGEGGDYVGIEVGADVSANVSLDDYMVFDNDQERATVFFRNLISKHAVAVDGSAGTVPRDPAELIRQAFTDRRAFEEFVRASEGVPRDAINILALSAQRALDEAISVQNIRVAAKHWYQRDKDKAVSANPNARNLLHWIIDSVIGSRRARAFLLRAGDPDDLIEALYDNRVLHVLKHNISTHDQPGVRYDVYKLDYGCYVDLIGTARAPEGLLPFEDSQFTDVPPDDYRSIRRAILSLAEFRSAGPGANLHQSS